MSGEPRSAAEEPKPVARRDKAADRELLGQVVAGKYRVQEVLGQGGFGSVFLVELTSGIALDRLAMKVLPKQFSANQTLVDQFVNEIRLAMKMVSPNIVQVRDVGETEDGQLYYTMDFAPGMSLSQLLKREKTLSPPRAMKIACRVLQALTTAHSGEVIHRDLKPANVMVDPGDGDATKVLDFGIATVVNQAGGGDGPPTKKRGFVGSPHYMPPEQFLGTEMGFYTDLYSVGVILYQCLTGSKPYRGKTPQEIYNHLKSGPPQAVDELAPEVVNYDGLTEVVTRAIERNPEKRFQSAQDFLQSLQHVLDGTWQPSYEDDFGEDEDDDEDDVDGRPGRRGRADSARVRPRRVRRRSSSPMPIVGGVIGVIVLVIVVLQMLPKAPRGDGVGGDRAANPEGGARSGKSSKRSVGDDDDDDDDDDNGSELASNPSVDYGDDDDDDDDGSREVSPEVVPSKFVDPKEQIADARKALKSRRYDDVIDLTNDVLSKSAEVSGKLVMDANILWARAQLGLSKPQAAIPALEQVHIDFADGVPIEDLYLLGSLYAESKPREDGKAKEILEELRNRIVKSPRAPKGATKVYDDTAELLATIYIRKKSRKSLQSILVESHERKTKSSTLKSLYEKYITKPREALAEQLSTGLANCVELQKKRDFEKLEPLVEKIVQSIDDAIDADESISATIDAPRFAGLLFLQSEAYSQAHRYKDAEVAIERFNDAHERLPSDAEVLPGMKADAATPWINFFRGRIYFLKRHLESSKKRRATLDASRYQLDNCLEHPATKSQTDLTALASSYRGSIMALEQDDFRELRDHFKPSMSSSNPEVILTQALAYRSYAERFEVRDPGLGERLDKEYRKKKSRKVKAKLDAFKEEKSRELDALDAATKRLLKLVKFRSLPPATKQRASALLGRTYGRRYALVRSSSNWTSAKRHFTAAKNAGLDTAEFHEHCGQFYVLRPDYVSAAGCYREAFRKRPSVDRCVRAAECFLEFNSKKSARDILQLGLKEFPTSKKLRALLYKAK
ncbi:MAG: serine/threonine-protein kinase [Planctomycetota bacterium]